MRRTRVGPTNASARMPSYFGSKLQPEPVGASVPIVAYIGSSVAAEGRRAGIESVIERRVP